MELVSDVGRPDTLPTQGIDVSPAELAAGRLTPDNHSLASFLLKTRGYVLLRDAMTLDFHKSLVDEFEAILADCRRTADSRETDSSPEAVHQVSLSRDKEASFWFRKSRYRIFPKIRGPFADPRFLANGLFLPVLSDLLGQDLTCRYVTSDTCLDGSILQSPHSDILMSDAWVDNAWKARGYVVNVPITECGLHNGPMEVWPGGSHLWTSAMMDQHGLHPYVQDGRNPLVEKYAEYLPSIKVAFKPGEILIRDLAMWHRGTPNPTPVPRTMMTVGYFRRGYEYGYADPRYNVDRATYNALPREVRPLFSAHFTLRKVLGRTRRKLQAQTRELLGKGG